MLYHFSFSRYQTKCVISGVRKSEVISIIHARSRNIVSGSNISSSKPSVLIISIQIISLYWLCQSKYIICGSKVSQVNLLVIVILIIEILLTQVVSSQVNLFVQTIFLFSNHNCQRSRYLFIITIPILIFSVYYK